MFSQIDHTALSEKVYLILRKKILSHELKFGEKIQIDEIASRLGVSRTPVQDAVNRPALEGLVEKVPRRGTFVTTLTLHDMVELLGSKLVGVAVDVYHLWWDPELEKEIKRCGSLGKLFAFHICDWKVPTADFLNDREIIGKGCIPLTRIREWVEAAGFTGYNEVEIFSNNYWQMDQDAYLEEMVEAYKNHS